MWVSLPAAQPALEYVGFWVRVVAAIVDSLILMVVTLPLTYMIYGRIGPDEGQFFQGPADVVINWLIPAALIIWLWSKLQATPGKLAMSARIVDADTGGTPKLSQLVIRYLGYFVSAIPLGLGLIWVGLDRRKQGWHDKMARTVVVRPAANDTVSFPNPGGQA